jgi:hypothetical protein
MQRLFSYSLLAGVAATSILTQAQTPKPSPADELRAARASYYTPTANGLHSFHCAVTTDWKDFLARITGTEITDDNPFLIYLRTVHLSVDDDVKTTGELNWSNTSTPAAEIEKPAEEFHGAMVQMFAGFFQTWNSFMNGSMVPEPDESSTVTRTSEGLHLHALSNDTVVDQNYNRAIVLTDAHVATSALDVLMYPEYADTADGKIVTVVRSTYRSPPNSPPTDLTMSVTYAVVSSYRLPATVTVDVKNVGRYDFAFAGCTVKKF